MSDETPETFSLILRAVRTGESGAKERLFELVYDELRRIAHGRRIRAGAGQTYQTTALVHEAYLRLAGASDPMHWNDRTHFVRAAALAMRHILVDRARREAAEIHGGGRRRVTLDDRVSARVAPVDLIVLDEALRRLAQQSSRLAEVVHCRFFLGMTVPETADVLGVSRRTVDSDWHLAKAWLRREMSGGFGVSEGAHDGP